tara:strand:+ start:952 stop:1497 length:546 start_codon:yes stop_codon:yes gene_type:complete
MENNNPLKSVIAISAIGPADPKIFGKITYSFTKCGCEILESKFSVMGDKFLLMAMLSGTWDAIAKIETALTRLGDNLGIKFSAERASNISNYEKSIPYVMEVVAVKNPSLVHDTVKFFELQKVVIKELQCGGFIANQTNTQMISLQVTISVPSSLSIASFRSDFVDFCDRLNIDAVLEPLK